MTVRRLGKRSGLAASRIRIPASSARDKEKKALPGPHRSRRRCANVVSILVSVVGLTGPSPLLILFAAVICQELDELGRQSDPPLVDTGLCFLTGGANDGP
jgi:hypothetical protein